MFDVQHSNINEMCNDKIYLDVLGASQSLSVRDGVGLNIRGLYEFPCGLCVGVGFKFGLSSWASLNKRLTSTSRTYFCL